MPLSVTSFRSQNRVVMDVTSKVSNFRVLSRADQSLTLLSHSRQELSSGFERPRGSRRQTCYLGRHRLGGESAHALVYSYAGFLIFSRGEV